MHNSSSRFDAKVVTRLVTISIALISLVNTGNAGECPENSHFEPLRLARPAEQREQVESLLPPWRTSDETVFVRFVAEVTEDGRMAHICCFSSGYNIVHGDREVLRNRLEKLQFSPPSRDGKPLRTWGGFTVLGRRTESGAVSRILFNRLISMDKYGVDYIAPRRIHAGSIWPYRNVKMTRSFYGEVLVDVNESGKPRNSRVGKVDVGSKHQLNGFAANMGGQCFIPGFVNGNPTPMAFSEIFHNISHGTFLVF